MVHVGKKPKRFKEDVPKPTELMQQRDGPLELDKNLNKTMIVNNPGGRGPGQPGFFCEVCNRTSKDSAAYLDHINGRSRKLYMLLKPTSHSSPLPKIFENWAKPPQLLALVLNRFERG